MKDIPGYEGLYSISEDGEVFSYRYQRFLKPWISQGYLTVNLIDADGKRKIHSIHRLIALTYIPNPKNLPVIDHIDRNKLNNSIENLRWVTIQENTLNQDWEKKRENYYNIPEEIRKERTQKACQAHARPIEMRDKNNHDILIKTYPNGYQAALQEFGDASKKSNISSCANGKRQSAYGYFWSFAPTNTDVSCEI